MRSMKKYRPTLSQLSPSLRQVGTSCIPVLLVCFVHLTAPQRIDAFVYGIEELESNIKILRKVDTVWEICFDILGFVCITVLRAPFQLEEII